MICYEMSMRVLALAVFLVACGTSSSEPDASASEIPAWCTAIDASACNAPTPSYATDVAPLLDRACNTTCHAPGNGPWPLTDYDDVSDWQTIIEADLIKCSMPPPDAGAGNGTLSDTERATILDWIACGAPNN